MRIATSTNIISSSRTEKRVPMIQFIPFLAEAGFNVLDLNFCEMMNPWSVLLTDGWKDYVHVLEQYRNKHMLVYNQAHAPYTHDRFGMDADAGRELDRQIFRSIEIAGMLGIPWIVLHAATDFSGASENRSLERNLEWIGAFVTHAEKAGTGIALENLDFSKTAQPEFTASVDDLIALIDAFGTSNVSACYDFGHAHLAGSDHQKNLLALGSRLTCLHVADNHGTKDEHLMPFYGTVPWETCMETLATIGYTGDLTYEVMFFSQYLPKDLQRSFLKHAWDVGSYLVGLFESASGGK